MGGSQRTAKVALFAALAVVFAFVVEVSAAPPTLRVNVSTVATGASIPDANHLFFPYYYVSGVPGVGYYYVLYQNDSDSKWYWRKSSDGASWDAPIEIKNGASSISGYGVLSSFGLDQYVLIIFDGGGESYRSMLGTIQAGNHSITWGASVAIWDSTYARRAALYGCKIGAARKWIVALNGGGDVIRNYVSDDDGSSWNLECTLGNSGGWYAWYWGFSVPFRDGNKLEFFESSALNTYHLRTTYWNDTAAGAEQSMVFRPQYYMDDDVRAAINTTGNAINMIYFDNANNLLHKRIYETDSWTSVGTVKAGVSADAGVGLAYDPGHKYFLMLWYETTTLRYKTYDGSSYGSETNATIGEADIQSLQVYPYYISGTNEFIMIWDNGTAVRFARIWEYTAPTIDHPADFAYNEGSTGNTISWTVGTDIASGPYTVYRNGTWWAAGTWFGWAPFNVDVDGCAAPFKWNFTVDASDGYSNVTDTVIVTVNAVQPSDNSPADQEWAYGTGGHTIGWVITDPGSFSGTYMLYRNTTCLNWPNGDIWQNNTNLAVDVDGLGAGLWNYTIEYWDGNCTSNSTDLVWVNVTKAAPALEMYLNGTAGDKNYWLGQYMNLTGTVAPGALTVVVEFAVNGTDISVPAAGVSTIVIDSTTWGLGTWTIQAHTDGNANYTAGNSAVRTLSIQSHILCNTPLDFSYNEGSVGNQIGWMVNSTVDITHFYTVYRDTVWYASGNWTNATVFNINVDGLPVGTMYNFTLDASDDLGNITDTVFVNVTAVAPTVNHPVDFGYTYGVGGNTIGWIVTDPGSPTGNYTVDRNGTSLGGPWVWTNNTNIAFNVDGLPAGLWNFTGFFWDGNSTANVTDIVFVTVSKATPLLGMYLNSTPGNKTYVICQLMNLTGNVTPASLTVVVRFTNGTAISVPALGVSTIIVDSDTWGPGDFLVVAYTAGNANYTAANSTVRKVTITNTAPSLNAPANQNINEGTSTTIPWLVLDPEHTTGSYDVYRNGTFHGSGSWTNNTLINYLTSVESVGVWNYTIVVSDGWATDVDVVLINVQDVLPSVNSPADIDYVLGTTGHTIGWIVTDPGSSAGNYTVERNATDLGGPWIWVNSTNLNFNVDGFGVGFWNVTIIVWDEFSASNVTDLVWVNVSAAVLKLIAQTETNPWTVGISGWINLTLNHSLGWANVSLADIQVNTTGDAQSFVLRWNRTSYTLTEISDPAAICTLVSWSNTTGTYNLTVRMKITITGGVPGWCDKRVNATGDGGAASDDFVPNAFLLGGIPTITHPPDMSYPEGSIGHVIPWMVNSSVDLSGNYTVYLNTVWYVNGIWNNATTFNVNVDGRPVGVSYNFTVDAESSFGNVTDTVFVNVTAVQPSVNHPVDFSYTYGTGGHTIAWIVTDPGSPTGNYTVDRNGTSLGGPWVWTNNTNIAFNVDGLGVGVWNFTGYFWDGNCTSNTTDIVFVTVTKAASTLHIYANGTEAAHTYYLGENMNVTGTVSPAILSVTTEFLNGTVIGGPSLGINTTVILAATWGVGAYQIRSHTVGSANYSAGFSVTITITISPSSVHLYINTTEADAFFNLSQIMNLTGVVYPTWLNVTVEFLNGTVISGPSLGVNKTYINTSDWGEGTYEVRAHGHASGVYPDSYSVTLVISIGIEREDWVVADSPANWWVFAYLLSTFTVLASLEGGRIRSALMNMFLGFPAALWMLAMQSGVVNGSAMILMLSVISPVAQIGVGMTNLFASALGGGGGSSS